MIQFAPFRPNRQRCKSCGRYGSHKCARAFTTKRCAQCKRRKSIRECFHRHSGKANGYHNVCKTCRRSNYRKMQRKAPQMCAQCGKKTHGRQYCEPCRLELQVVAEQAFEQEAPLAPTICGLTRFGKQCLEVVSDTCDREGRGVIYCPKHGYRLAPVVRPAEFHRYDQRGRLEKELGGFVARAQAPADPKMSARNSGSSKRRGSIGFIVGGAHGPGWEDVA